MTSKENQIDFTKWQVDRDIPESIWNSYMNKYQERYVILTGGDNINKIKCVFGHIEPYSLKKGYLMFYGKFPTPSKKTNLLKKIKGLGFDITQEAYDEFCFKFKESSLGSLLELLKIKKRMKLTNEQRQDRANNMKKIMEARK